MGVPHVIWEWLGFISKIILNVWQCLRVLRNIYYTYSDLSFHTECPLNMIIFIVVVMGTKYV